MAHNRKVLVFADVNYGASKTSASANTALNPADLAVGACGVYAIQLGGSTNVGKLVLVTNGGSEAAGKCPASGLTAKEVFVCQGIALSAGGSASRESNAIGITPVTGLIKAAALAYTAPTLGVARIGYNPSTTSGSMNLPATINRGDDCIIEIFNRNYVVSGVREPGQKVNLSSQPAQGDSQYVVLEKWVAAVTARSLINPIGDNLLIDVTKIKILSNASGSAFTNSATASVTNGSTAVTTSAAHGVTNGQYITLNGDLYLASAASGSSITLDRPYQGATNAALANNLTVNTASTTAPTLMGLELVDNAQGRNLSFGVNGDFSNATIAKTTLANNGSGSNLEVVALEKEALGNKGSEDQITRYMPLDTIYSQVSGLTYDLFFFETHNSNQPNGDNAAVFKTLNYLTTAFVSGVSGATGKNERDFQTIMQALFASANIPSIN